MTGLLRWVGTAQDWREIPAAVLDEPPAEEWARAMTRSPVPEAWAASRINQRWVAYAAALDVTKER